MALLSTAVLAVRGAMGERRERAELAWQKARECALAGAARPTPARTEQLRRCSETARTAAELSLELPEHSREQLELRTALDELVVALESGDETRVAHAIDRSARAGSALGWRMVQARLP
jgi:hypothetical protein